ncbi:hypothetical protein CAEBREN_18187 [Caenorhabditis brenneri]|uniref:Uncharacterized protein n=1 Tax=Caenorhabditis brenneri TaxID=135651 RepID=G0NDR6_CAEBE|nr:hypothetical protein CAEBREN_18187 [Caenorhabditis brenneri]
MILTYGTGSPSIISFTVTLNNSIDCFSTIVSVGIVFTLCISYSNDYISTTMFKCYFPDTWCMACAATVSLFINRIISIGFREYADVVEKKLAYSSIAFVLFYGFYIFYFTPSLAYNSDIMAWLPDPLSEETPSKEAAAMYKNTIQAWNNWIFVTCMFVLFSVYFMMVKRLARGQKSKASKAIFIQCSIICFFNTAVALVYNALAIVSPAPWILAFGQICWAFNHACPAIIYVTMNDTIRREFYRLVFRVNVAPVSEEKRFREKEKFSESGGHNKCKEYFQDLKNCRVVKLNWRKLLIMILN